MWTLLATFFRIFIISNICRWFFSFLWCCRLLWFSRFQFFTPATPFRRGLEGSFDGTSQTSGKTWRGMARSSGTHPWKVVAREWSTFLWKWAALKKLKKNVWLIKICAFFLKLFGWGCILPVKFFLGSGRKCWWLMYTSRPTFGLESPYEDGFLLGICLEQSQKRTLNHRIHHWTRCAQSIVTLSNGIPTRPLREFFMFMSCVRGAPRGTFFVCLVFPTFSTETKLYFGFMFFSYKKKVLPACNQPSKNDACLFNLFVIHMCHIVPWCIKLMFTPFFQKLINFQIICGPSSPPKKNTRSHQTTAQRHLAQEKMAKRSSPAVCGSEVCCFTTCSTNTLSWSTWWSHPFLLNF